MSQQTHIVMFCKSCYITRRPPSSSSIVAKHKRSLVNPFILNENVPSPDDDAGIIRSTTSILSNGPEQIEEDDDGTMLSRQRQAGLEQIADDDPAPVPLAMEADEKINVGALELVEDDAAPLQLHVEHKDDDNNKPKTKIIEYMYDNWEIAIDKC